MIATAALGVFVARGAGDRDFGRGTLFAVAVRGAVAPVFFGVLGVVGVRVVGGRFDAVCGELLGVFGALRGGSGVDVVDFGALFGVRGLQICRSRLRALLIVLLTAATLVFKLQSANSNCNLPNARQAIYEAMEERKKKCD